MSHALSIAVQFAVPFCVIGSVISIMLVRAGALADQLSASADERAAQPNQEPA